MSSGASDAAAERRAPGSPSVFREQLLVVGQKHGVLLLAMTLLGTLVALTSDFSITVDPDRFVFESVKPGGLLPVLLTVAFLWPLLLWQRSGEEWHYYRSLPIDHARHDRLRAAAGGTWLLLAASAMLVLPLLVAVLGAASEPQRASAALWTSLFLGPLTVYFLGSALAMRARAALLWIVTAVVALHVAAGLLLPQAQLWKVLTWPLTGPVGLVSALWQPFVHVSSVVPPFDRPSGVLWVVGAIGWLCLAASINWLCAGGRRES